MCGDSWGFVGYFFVWRDLCNCRVLCEGRNVCGCSLLCVRRQMRTCR